LIIIKEKSQRIDFDKRIMRSQNKETNDQRKEINIYKKKTRKERKNEWSLIRFLVHLRGRNFRRYSPPDSGVVGVVAVGVFLFALVRAFFGGV